MFRGVSLNPDFLISEQGNIMPCLICLGFLCICNSGMIMLLDLLSLIIMREEYLRDITAVYLTDCFLDSDILGADQNFQCFYFIRCHLPVCTTVLGFSKTRVFVPFKLRSLSPQYHFLCIIDIDKCELLHKISKMHICTCVLRFIFVHACVCICACMYTYTHECVHACLFQVYVHMIAGVSEGRKMVSDSLELKLQATLSCPMV